MSNGVAGTTIQHHPSDATLVAQRQVPSGRPRRLWSGPTSTAVHSALPRSGSPRRWAVRFWTVCRQRRSLRMPCSVHWAGLIMRATVP